MKRLIFGRVVLVGLGGCISVVRGIPAAQVNHERN